MAKKQTYGPIFVAFGGFLLAVLLMVSVYFMFQQSKVANHPSSEITSATPVEKEDSDKVCLPRSAYEKLIAQPQQPIQSTPLPQPPVTTERESGGTQERDYRVLSDPLYPPLNRVDSATYNMLQRNIQQRNILVPTSVRETNDTYRLVGYLVNKDGDVDTGGNNWKLMARMKDKNTADFYMIPANKNYDMKINVTDEIVDGQRLRDIYTIPNQVKFKTPLLNDSPYDFVEVEKSDLTFTNGGMYI